MSIRKKILYGIFIILLVVPTLFAGKNWKYYYKKGLIQYKAEMYNYSMENMIKAFDRNKKLYQALNVIAELYLLKHDNENAMKKFIESIKINPAQPEIQNRVGEMYFFYASYQTAKKYFFNAVKYDNKNTRGYFNISRYFYKRKNYNEGDKYFNISLKYGNIQTKEILKNAETKFKEKKYDESIKLFQSVIKKNPGSVMAYMNIYKIERKRGNFLKAVEYLEKLKKVKPNYHPLYIHLGNLYFSKKFSGKRIYYLKLALKNLKKGLYFKRENAEAYFTLANIYNFMGKDQEAEKMEKLGFKYLKKKKSKTP